MSDCIFCKIATGKMNTELLYKDEQVVAFNDINPQAPTHILVIPIIHYESVKEMDDEGLIGRLFTVAKKVAEQVGLKHYRLVINTGIGAGQSVFHTHLHVLGGRLMGWPPG
jgi:histidine triad (HIT) family protein